MNRHPFRVLLQLFLFKVVDPELVSSGGDPEKLLGQMVAVLLGASFVTTIPLLFMSGHLPDPVAAIFAHFFIATTMLVVGVFAVLSWDEVFPDRRDVLVLASLPIESKTIFSAKMAAIGAGLGVAVGALNGISGLLWPWLFAPAGSGSFGPLLAMASFWLTLVLAAMFVFGAALTMHGLAAHVLPRGLFLRLSSAMQLGLFCVLVSVYVLEPSLESKAALSSAANQRLLEWLPSYWFWGMFEQLSGAAAGMRELSLLAQRAWIGVAIAVGGAITTVMLNYFRAMQRVMEEPEIVPGRRRLFWRVGGPTQRAVLSFALQTIARSRRHRMMLSFYMGTGFGVMLILLRPSMGSRNGTAVALLAGSVLMFCTAAMAMRTVFSLPMMLEANWIFRMAVTEQAESYMKAVRNSFLLLAMVPVWSGFAVLLGVMLPWRAAAAHLAFLAVFGIMLADLCVAGFGKIPFTCSYRPGKGNLQFALWGVMALLPLTLLGAHYEWAWLGSTRGQLMLALAPALPAAALHWWTTRRLRRASGLMFEDLEAAPIVSLDLAVDRVVQRRASV